MSINLRGANVKSVKSVRSVPVIMNRLKIGLFVSFLITLLVLVIAFVISALS